MLMTSFNPSTAQNNFEFLKILKRQIVLRKIAPYQDEWGIYFLKDIEPRGITAIELDDHTYLLSYGKRRRIRLEIKVRENDLWIYSKLQNHPLFLIISFSSFGISVALIVGIFYFFFGSQAFESFMWIPFISIYIICFASFLIGAILRGKGYLDPRIGIPDYSEVFLDIYESANYAADRILEQYALKDQAPTQTQVFCPICKRPMEPSWIICPFCGTPL
ncbi:MAG: zinc ribbon domain-containing protein [Candidatus Helarchaeota archaeon]